MLMRQNTLPVYNVQTAVDAEHSLIVAQTVVLDAADSLACNRWPKLQGWHPEIDNLQIMADAGYSNGEQAAQCEAAGMLPHVPVMCTVNNQGDGTLLGREDFRYEPEINTYICPGNRRSAERRSIEKIAT